MGRSISLRWKIAIGVAIFLLAFWMSAGYIAADFVTRAHHGSVRPRTEIAGKPLQPVTIQTEDGLNLSAWYVPNSADRAVIVLAGIYGDRDACISNAEVYLDLGYSALLPDLRGTGESEGDRISIGWHERKDLIACFNYLRGLGYQHIGAHGTSLGAATICFAAKDLPELAFAVLESSYDTIDNALNNRLDLFNVPHFLAWPMKLSAQYFIGAGPREIQPLAHMPHCTAPTLVMGGDSEKLLKVSETKDLFDRCAASVKRLHIFKGGRHEVFVRRFGDECRPLIRAFLEEAAATWPAATAHNSTDRPSLEERACPPKRPGVGGTPSDAAISLIPRWGGQGFRRFHLRFQECSV